MEFDKKRILEALRDFIRGAKQTKDQLDQAEKSIDEARVAEESEARRLDEEEKKD